MKPQIFLPIFNKLFTIILLSVFFIGCEEDTGPELVRLWNCPFEIVNGSVSWDGSNLWISGAEDYTSEQKYFCVSTNGQIVSSFIAPGGVAGDIEWDGEHLWVNDASRIYRVTKEGAVTDTLPQGLPIGQMVWAGNNMWIYVHNNNEWYKINENGEVIETYEPPYGSAGSAWDGKFLCTLTSPSRIGPGESSNTTLHRLTLGGTEAESYWFNKAKLWGLAWDGSSFWTLDTYGYGNIYRACKITNF